MFAGNKLSLLHSHSFGVAWKSLIHLDKICFHLYYLYNRFSDIWKGSGIIVKWQRPIFTYGSCVEQALISIVV